MSCGTAGGYHIVFGCNISVPGNGEKRNEQQQQNDVLLKSNGIIHSMRNLLKSRASDFFYLRKFAFLFSGFFVGYCVDKCNVPQRYLQRKFTNFERIDHQDICEK